MDLFKSFMSKTIDKMNPGNGNKTNEDIFSGARQESVKIWESLIAEGHVPKLTEDKKVEYIELDDIYLSAPFKNIFNYTEPIAGLYVRLVETYEVLKDKNFKGTDYLYGRFYEKKNDVVKYEMSTVERLSSAFSDICETRIIPKSYYFESWDGGLNYFKEFLVSLGYTDYEGIPLSLAGKFKGKITRLTMDYLDLRDVGFIVDDKVNLFAGCSFNVLILPYAFNFTADNGIITSVFNSCKILSLYVDTITFSGNCELNELFTNTEIKFLHALKVISLDTIKCHKLLDSYSDIRRLFIELNVNELELVETFKNVELRDIQIIGKVNKLSCKDAFVGLKVNTSNLSAFKECKIPKSSLKDFKSNTAVYEHLLTQAEYDMRESGKYPKYDV